MDPQGPSNPSNGIPPPPSEPASTAQIDIPVKWVDSSAPLGVGSAIVAFLVAFFAAQTAGGILMVAAIAVLLMSGAAPVPNLLDPDAVRSLLMHPIPLLVGAVASSATFVASVVVTCKLSRKEWSGVVQLRRSHVSIVAAAVVGIGALGVLVDEVVRIVRQLVPSIEMGALESLSAAARAEGLPMRIFSFTAMTIVPGIAEEIFFRGFFQRAFVERFRAPIGIGVASLVFGAVHVDPPQAIGAAITGAMLGWVAYRASSIVPAIAAHIANNALAYIGANIPAMEEYGSGAQHYPLTLIAGAAAVVVACMVWIAYRTQPQS